MRSLLLGLDVSPRRMGWALCDLVSGEPVACGCEAIELPKNGWDRGAVTQALHRLPVGEQVYYEGDPVAWIGEYAEVEAVYVEHPISRFPGMAYDEGRAVGMVHCEVQRRWPHAPVEYLKPSEWKKLAGLKGNASKAEVFGEASDLLFPVFGRDVARDYIEKHGGQDAADALLIAVAGQRRNGENWDRAVERGEAA